MFLKIQTWFPYNIQIWAKRGILKRKEKIDGKPYLFFDEIQEVDAWETCRIWAISVMKKNHAVSTDEFDMSRNGIKHRNVRDFLIEDWG